MHASTWALASANGYWYPTQAQESGTIEILELLRKYQENEVKTQSRVRGTMQMGDRDLLALRFLLAAQSESRVLRQKDLAQKLAITSASASTLVDRLVRDGFAERVAHPEDRRSVAVIPTAKGRAEVEEALTSVHHQMLDVVSGFSPKEREVITQFLEKMNACLEGQEPAQG